MIAAAAQRLGLSYLPLINTDAIAIVDRADLALVMSHEWRLQSEGYANVANGPDAAKYLHRFLLRASAADVVDHANGNKLDNRRANLRLAAPINNSWNMYRSRKHRVGYKGVWPVSPNSWQAQIRHSGCRHYLGVFPTPEAAARAYDDAALQYFGEFARLNFPDDPSRSAIRAVA